MDSNIGRDINQRANRSLAYRREAGLQTRWHGYHTTPATKPVVDKVVTPQGQTSVEAPAKSRGISLPQ
jgi:hypothetical protein